MPEPRFKALKKQLLAGGVKPRYIKRTVIELKDHYRDLKAEALRAGMSADAAARFASIELGDQESIARAVLARPELRNWTQSWPRLASGLRTVVLLAVMPAVPVVYCYARSASIARWSISAGLATLVTAALMLGLRSLLLF